MKKCLRYFLFSILLLFILFILTGCGNEDTYEKLQSKVIEEVRYLDTNIITMLNLLNNIQYDNYSVSKKDISNNSENNSGSSDNTLSSQEAQDAAKPTERQTEGSISEGENSSSEDPSQSQSIMTMEKNGILTRNNDSVDWNTLKEVVEELYNSWNTIALDMHSLNIDNTNILDFTNILNDCTKNIQAENKADTMNSLVQLYSLLPKYVENNNDEILLATLNTKLEVLNAYILVEDENWDEITKRMQSAEGNFTSIINNVDINSRNQSGVSQTYIVLKELQRSIEAKDKDIFYINYKNFMQEIQSLK